MGKDTRLYAEISIEMDEHPKIIGLSDAAFRALFEALLYSRRMMSDGVLDERVVLRRWGQAVADELSSNDPESPSWVRLERGWIIHDFLEHNPSRSEIQAKRADLAVKRSAAGSKGAANRWQSDSKPVANDSEEKRREEKKNNVQAALEHDFDSFWEVFPRKEGKQAARRKYLTVRRTTPAAPLLEGAKAYALLSLGKEKQHVKMAQGWLNDGRWADELQSSIPLPPRGDAVSAHTHRWMADGTCLHCEERQENPF